MEPNDGMSLWDTGLIGDFLNAHVRAKTIREFVIFTKKATPRRFHVAIKYRYPKDEIMTDVSLIFWGTITNKIPILNIIGHLTWSEWRGYKKTNGKRTTGRDSNGLITIN